MTRQAKNEADERQVKAFLKVLIDFTTPDGGQAAGLLDSPDARHRS